jgi:hypothetical protein
MKRGLELKDVCGYLPHGLKVAIDRGETRAVATCFGELNEDLRAYSERANEVFIGENDNMKPILRPLSDLYKTITHNGKEIVPIVELAKVSFPKFSWGTSPNKFGAFAGAYRFDFYENIKCFDCSCNGRQVVVDCQIQLYDYLNELKIDCRGLIESGLAIDANTLEINPYK